MGKFLLAEHQTSFIVKGVRIILSFREGRALTVSDTYRGIPTTVA
jgi:hypothetical protein